MKSFWYCKYKLAHRGLHNNIYPENSLGAFENARDNGFAIELDVRLLKDIFIGVDDDSLGHAANYIDGAKSILTGIAANQSMKTGLPVDVKTLVKF